MSDVAKLRKAVAIHTCLTCQDIPEVQAIIRLLSPMLLEQYAENLEDSLGAVLLDLQDFMEEEDTDGEDIAFFVTALWLSSVRDLSSVDPEIDRAAAVGARKLASTGAKTALAPLGGLAREIATPGADDLRFWFARVAVTDPLIEIDFKARVTAFLLDPSQHSTAGRLSLVSNLREILLRARRSVAVTLDLWAYRWYAIGALEGLTRKHGLDATFVAFNNPPAGPDSKTTPFCKAVHGQPISARNARRQVQSFLNAVAERDYRAAQDAWPVLSARDAAGEGEDFEEIFARLALPPYHFFCRTVVRES